MIEPLESRELFSSTHTATEPEPTSAKPLFAWYAEDLDGRVGVGRTSIATEKVVIAHEGFEIR